VNVLKQIEVKRDRMMQNLSLSRDAIVAEPLYIILGLHGCPDPYDWSKKLVQASKKEGRKMTDLVATEPALEPYFSQFTDAEKEVINHPEQYIGNAIEVTLETCKVWTERTRKLVNKPDH